MAEQLANLAKGDELINRPDLWVVGTEYNFGNGLYGQRFNISVTKAANTQDKTMFFNQNVEKIISYGGSFDVGDGVSIFPIPYVSDSGTWGASIYSYTGSGCTFVSMVGLARTNAPVDIWMLYKKS